MIVDKQLDSVSRRFSFLFVFVDIMIGQGCLLLFFLLFLFGKFGCHLVPETIKFVNVAVYWTAIHFFLFYNIKLARGRIIILVFQNINMVVINVVE